MKKRTALTTILLLMMFLVVKNVQAEFADDFSGDLTSWSDIYGESWNIDNGELYGKYAGECCGSSDCHGADLVLKAQHQLSGDWKTSVDFKRIDATSPDALGNLSAAEFILWKDRSSKIVIFVGTWDGDEGDKSNIVVSLSKWQEKHLDQNWRPLSNGHDNSSFEYHWDPEKWQTVTLEKRGDTYQIYINGIYLTEFVDDLLGGEGKIGLFSCRANRFDNFRHEALSQDEQTPYQEGYADGMQKCTADPASCGIIVPEDCFSRFAVDDALQEGYTRGRTECSETGLFFLEEDFSLDIPSIIYGGSEYALRLIYHPASEPMSPFGIYWELAMESSGII